MSRPEGLEEQLRADITRYPQSPALHFTLGNLYASQSRWNEAQAATSRPTGSIPAAPTSPTTSR